MSNFKKEIVEKVLAELDYQKNNFGKKAVDLAGELDINRATLSKLRKFEHYEKQINSEKMQEVLDKLIEMRQQANQQKQETKSLLQFNGYNIDSLVGEYLDCAQYDKTLIWNHISIAHMAEEDIFTVKFVNEQRGSVIYKGNYRIMNGFLYLDLINEELQDKIMLIIYLGSIAFYIRSKEVLTGVVIRTSREGKSIISQKMLMVKKDRNNTFTFEGEDDEMQEHLASLSDREKEDYVKHQISLAMGASQNNFFEITPVESFLFENIKKINPNWQADLLLRTKFAGRYESYYCSPSHDRDYRFSIKIALLIIKEDGSATLRTPYQIYKGKASLDLDTDILEIRAVGGEFSRENKQNGSLTMTFSLGGIWKNGDFKVEKLHGVSASIYMDGGPVVMREALIKIDGKNELFQEVGHRKDIPIGSEDYWKIIFDNSKEGKIKKDLFLFLSGQTDNYIKTFRNPNNPFEKREDYGLLYFTSALYWAGQQEYEECVKNLGMALLHGFHEMELLEKEFKGGTLSHEEIRSKFKPQQLNGKTYYSIPKFREILEKTTWKFFRQDLNERWLKSFPK